MEEEKNIELESGNKILNLFKNKLFLLMMIPVVIGFLGIIFYSIIYATNFNIGATNYSSILDACKLSIKFNGIHIACICLVVLYGLNIFCYALGILVMIKKKAIGLYTMSIFGLCLSLILLFISIGYDLFSGGINFLIVFTMILYCAAIVLIVFLQKKHLIYDSLKEKKEVIINSVREYNPVSYKLLLVVGILALVSVMMVFFIPLFSYNKETIVNDILGNPVSTTTEPYAFWLLKAFNGEETKIVIQIAFIAVLLSFIILVIYFINSLAYINKYKIEFVKRINSLIYISFIFTLVFFLIGYFITVYYNYKGTSATTISFIPFIVNIIILLAYSILKGKIDFFTEKIKTREVIKCEPLIYVIILTLISCATLFINLITIEFQYAGGTAKESFSGLNLLMDSDDNGGYQVVSFVVFAIIITSVILFVLSLSAYASNNDKVYSYFTKLSIYVNVIMMFIIGMFGFYYAIVQKINEENILLLLENSGYNISFDFVQKITSQGIYLFVGALIVLIVAICRKQLNSVQPVVISESLPQEQSTDNIVEEPNNEQEADSESDTHDNPEIKDKALEDFDSCPAFTELDNKKPMFDNEYNNKQSSIYLNPTLPSLVKFIVDYARESRLHLSYTHEDIATFIAGLGASRLSILQGMSGTGKTSLPKIVCEALLGSCEIVEVESSWRDKNELLGYYNEFSKSYSPKKFTQSLYKAKLNPEIITFIVLDEMNLSRIEYYFSDFLSLMEHEEDKREIKLLNVKLNRIENNIKYDYLALTDGHTLKIPNNVWFIGTANRDESTFEISDKVYDRAQTMNFNKRAPKVRSYTEPIPQKFLEYSELSRLLNDAISNGVFEAEDSEIIKGVEKILQPFNISFGNRVLKQIEEFVKIYCACFSNGEAVLNDAVEKIILSKVVAKLEYKNIENKEKLVYEFNKLGLSACSEFVSKLNED